MIDGAVLMESGCSVTSGGKLGTCARQHRNNLEDGTWGTGAAGADACAETKELGN